MKQKRMTALAIACGVLCAACVIAFMFGVQGEANSARAEALARYGGEQVEVCVATRDISAGERIDSAAVEMRLWVADLLPEGALSMTSDVVGKTPSASILKGEVYSAKRFDRDHDAIDVPAGMEAISVPVKAVQAVGGAIRRGMRVDVYSSSGSGTTLLAQDVLVIDTSVGESNSLTASDSGWITLALEADRVQEVVAATYKTDISFALPGADINQASDDGAVEQAAEQPDEQHAEQSVKQSAEQRAEEPAEQLAGQSAEKLESSDASTSSSPSSASASSASSEASAQAASSNGGVAGNQDSGNGENMGGGESR